MLILSSPSSDSKVGLLVFSLILAFTGCARNKAELVEQRPHNQPTPAREAAAPINLPKLAPQAAEVQDAVRRVFKDVAVVDTSSQPSFIVGDFNGDASQDLAVVVKPATGKVEAINEVYPAWLLRDPFEQNSSSTPQLRVSDNESLLAVIHGHGTNDWRDPQATQTYLLKNAAGRNLETTTSGDFVRANSGRKIPRLHGDVISEVVRGNQGCLYFSRASYRWYDPKTYRDESTVSPTAHGRGRQSAN